MHEPRDSSLGTFLGSIAVLGGALWLGLGLASMWKGQGSEGVDGLLFGGLAFVAGCVILCRRTRTAKSKQNEPGPARSDAADGTAARRSPP
jgi:hypothetical protein